MCMSVFWVCFECLRCVWICLGVFLRVIVVFEHFDGDLGVLCVF